MVSARSSERPAAARSVSTSMSTSNGCAISRSKARTPCVPMTRRPRISTTSLMQGGGHGHELPPRRPHLPVEDLLYDGDGLWPGRQQPGVEEVAGHHTHESVAQLLHVDEDALAFGQPR